MQTSTSLSFFIAIFEAFSGVLAEELMIILPAYVITELYRLCTNVCWGYTCMQMTLSCTLRSSLCVVMVRYQLGGSRLVSPRCAFLDAKKTSFN